MRYLITALLLVASHSSGDAKKIPCPLTWLRVTGVSSLPTAVATSILHPDNYVVRASVGGRLVVGNFPTSLQYGLFPNGTGGVALTSFELLANPHSCSLAWEIEPDKAFGVKVGDLSVARASHGGKLIAGFVEEEEMGVIVTEGLEVVRMEVDFQYLTSFLPGLRLSVGKMKLTYPPIVPTYQLIGMEDILNFSPAVVKQTIEHKTRSYESVTVKTWSSWYSGSRFSLQAKLSIPIPIAGPIGLNIDVGLDINDENDEGGFKSNTMHKAVTKEISVGREITVEPHSVVQACSIVIKVKDFRAEYSSEDVYSAPGLTGQDVRAHLEEDGITGGRIVGNTVVIENGGDIDADMFVTTRFFAKPYEDGGVPCGFE